MGLCVDDIDRSEKQGEGTVGTNDINEDRSHVRSI